MNFWKKIILLFFLVTAFISYIPAQNDNSPTVFDTTDFPQWVKDLRRWEIVAFGTVPFTIFTASFAMDMYRWSTTDFSDRRYAPWPLKSTGAVPRKRWEQELIFVMAASLSVTIALTDQIIVQVKRYKARKRAEAIPVGTTIITRTPLPDEAEEEQDGNIMDEAVPVTPEP